jgi:hypothetical protein
MGKESETNRSTNELSAKIAASRERVECNLRGLDYELDFKAKLHRSYLHYTTYWVSGAAVVGVLMTLLPTREKKIYMSPERNRKTKNKLAESGFALGALNIAVNLIRPAMAEFVKNRLRRTVRGSVQQARNSASGPT